MNRKYIGAHVSASGGVSNAPLNAAAIGANSFALFIKNQRQWKAKAPEQQEANNFTRFCDENGFDKSMILAHDSYLINLAHPEPEKLEKSRNAFIDEMKRCAFFGVRKLNFHPGSTLGKVSPEEALIRVAESINLACKIEKTVIPVIENTAGQGNTLGSTFEDLALIIEHIEDKSRIGVCIDTAHTFESGYDFRDEESYNRTMTLFEDIVGFEYLMGMHLNDSKTELASRVDRHHSLGQGHIGIWAFEHLMKDSRTDNIPLILETINSDIWDQEIKLLRSFV